MLTHLIGKIIAHGLVTVPALLLAQAQDGVSQCAILKVWRRMYQRGHAHGPKIAILTSGAFVYLTWCSSRATGNRVPMLLFGTAASLVTGIVPFTLLFMRPTNNALMARAAEEDALLHTPVQSLDQKSSEQLFAHWANLTGVRALLPLAGGVLGLVAVLNH